MWLVDQSGLVVQALDVAQHPLYVCRDLTSVNDAHVMSKQEVSKTSINFSSQQKHRNSNDWRGHSHQLVGSCRHA